MANGRVDDLAWGQIRVRRTLPPCVFDTIPPEDLQAFLRLIATNPLQAFPDAFVVRSKITSLKFWRSDTANPNTVTKEISYARASVKRRRDEVDISQDAPCNTGNARGTQVQRKQPRKKHRRSSRPAMSSSVSAVEEAPHPGDYYRPKVGPQHQADVPDAPFSREYLASNPPIFESRLTFSEEAAGGAAAVTAYTFELHNAFQARDGFPLAPFQLELALQELVLQKGDKDAAKKVALKNIPRGLYFPGIKAAFRYEEQCLFVRTLAERAKNFSYISTYILPNRSTSELVWLYYSRHKQLWMQNGGTKGGLVLDDGGDKLKRVGQTAERALCALRGLAITAGDGFPIDSRANITVIGHRRAVVNLARSKDEDIGRRTPRQRNN